MRRFDKRKNILEANLRLEKSYLINKGLLKEAIVDQPSKNLSDIFQKGKLNPKVKKTIIDGLNRIKQQFPDLNIIDSFMVGAAVTFQYSPESDIDTTVTIDKDTPEDLMKKADKWIEANLDGKVKWLGKRPFQWKISKGTRNELSSADSAYDLMRDTWIKQPSFEKSMEMYNKKIKDEKSLENNVYRKAEPIIQNSLKNLLDAINTGDDSKVAPAVANSYNKYEKFIKGNRKETYGGEVEKGFVSNNWGYGNVLYKFFDREGYNNAFSLMSKMVKNNDFKNQEILDKLKSTIPVLLKSKPGYEQ